MHKRMGGCESVVGCKKIKETIKEYRAYMKL